MKKITKDMMIKEIFLSFPDKALELSEALAACGLRCVSCCASAFESLEEGLKNHGIADQDIDRILDHLNAILE